jgi:FkbM family methyltransferase
VPPLRRVRISQPKTPTQRSTDVEQRVSALEDERDALVDRIASIEERRAELESRLSLVEQRSDATFEDDLPRPLQQLTKAERQWRGHLLGDLGGLVQYLAVNVQGSVYFFDPRDAKSGRTLFIEQAVRRDQTQLRRAVDLLESAGGLAVRDVFLDVGAHIGTTTIYAVRHVGFASAVAIEPVLENMLLLRLSTIANGLDGAIRTVQAAVADEVGVSSMDVGGAGSEYHRLSAGAESPLRQLVTTTTLDELVADGTIDPARVSLIWMDIEGYEAHALTAATELLGRAVPLVTEACPAKLARVGMLDRLSDLLATHYTHVHDLRQQRAAGFRPISELGELIRAYDGHCTDVLVCRLPDAL